MLFIIIIIEKNIFLLLFPVIFVIPFPYFESYSVESVIGFIVMGEYCKHNTKNGLKEWDKGGKKYRY